jgi:hypothetical protein
MFFTAFVLETLDLITNDKPIPIWYDTTIFARPSIKGAANLSGALAVPEGINWGDVSIIFISDESVEIRAREPLGVKNFIELGFKDKRSNKPNLQWVLLKAIAQVDGKLSWKNTEELPVSWKPHIKMLRKRLRRLFRIEEDPLFPYKRGEGYRTKFKIMHREEN